MNTNFSNSDRTKGIVSTKSNPSGSNKRNIVTKNIDATADDSVSKIVESGSLPFSTSTSSVHSVDRIGKRRLDSESTSESNSDNDNWESVVRKRKRPHKRKSEFDEIIDDKVEPNSSTAGQTGYYDIRTPIERKNEENKEDGLVTLYLLKTPKLDIQCLKCRADVDDHIGRQEIVFKQEGLTVVSVTQKDQGKDIPLCEIFDNSFVQSHRVRFEVFWKQILSYVMNDHKHMIDLHGMTILVAQAAIEFAVARERRYVKSVLGSGMRIYKELEIISGQGVHSFDRPVLPETVSEHLRKLKCKKVTRSIENPGIFNVDVRYKT